MSVRDVATKHLQGIKPAGEGQLQSRCPFHNTKTGTPFSINTKNGMWICFSCGESGSFPKFLRKLGYTQEQVGRILSDTALDVGMPDPIRRRLDAKKTWKILPEYVLGAFDSCPNDLLTAGFTMETLREADVGYDSREDRITFGIRDYLGRLVAVSGRARQGWIEPKYKVYDSIFEPLFEDHEYKPQNKLHVYGLDTFYPRRFYQAGGHQPPLIIVEGYKGTLWLRQQGFSDVGGLMGSTLSASQCKVLSRLTGPFYVLLDNEPGKAFPDDKGRCAAVRVALQLSAAGPAFVCQYPEGSPEGTSPDDLKDKDIINVILATAKTPAQLAVRKDTTKWTRHHELRSIP
jgi:DNA primase